MNTDEMKELMHLYGDYLTRLSYVYVKNWTVAEDIVQDVFIKYFQAQQYKGQANIKTYLAKMTIHKSCDYLRSIKNRLRILEGFWKNKQQTMPSSEQQTLKKLEQHAIAKAVLELPIKYREVIVLFYYEDMTSLEIATLLNTSENTIKTRLRRGRDLLKTSLGELQLGGDFYE
ncbi:sigma-70 family RNA polymerase sigma factor [Bacillus ndiopicus]|uniref:sigma-70 family RNA polymerase sigma factor n=1 Tax=Bacillus ndiopicus TaxID=1347368 RepID=UPI0009DCA2C6|nr:sigma-70 family RNA polymerase sigma factor [Bacillus ndiopicus]